ncbi:helix-turn-helix transcriptional regulator [Candidatus Woesearchaeota archaeon]|nr:helix-turn-helix transcriptional regulator [Candidatus Woesearchaeota archaeon]
MYKCPIFQVADIIGKKWSIVVIQEVALNGSKGFNAIHHRMEKVSPKLLSQRLKDLEKFGIITKKILAGEMPVRTSYSLTKQGKELQEIITSLRKWYAKHNPNLEGCERRECVKCPLY